MPVNAIFDGHIIGFTDMRTRDGRRVGRIALVRVGSPMAPLFGLPLEGPKGSQLGEGDKVVVTLNTWPEAWAEWHGHPVVQLDRDQSPSNVIHTAKPKPAAPPQPSQARRREGRPASPSTGRRVIYPAEPGYHERIEKRRA